MTSNNRANKTKAAHQVLNVWQYFGSLKGLWRLLTYGKWITWSGDVLFFFFFFSSKTLKGCKICIYEQNCRTCTFFYFFFIFWLNYKNSITMKDIRALTFWIRLKRSRNLIGWLISIYSYIRLCSIIFYSN